MTRRAPLVLAVLALALILPAAASACAGGWTTTGIQQDLMCPTCNQRLDQSHSAIADRIRAYLDQSCRAGRTEAQVKDALVAQFGQEVLAAPPARGFGLLAWVVPAAVLAAGAALAAGLALAWSRRRGAAGATAPLTPDLEARIDDDLRRIG
jgi:cytochrome c-type biogenesis protein CcmH/NrfF